MFVNLPLVLPWKLSTLNHVEPQVQVTRPDIGFCLFLLHFQSIEVISLPWRQKLVFYWHQSTWLGARIWEWRVMLLCFPVTSVSQRKDQFALGRCYINFFGLSSWKCHIMRKNAYHKTKMFLVFFVSLAKHMVMEEELNGTGPHGCSMDKLLLLRRWKKGNWAEIFKEQKVNILYRFCSCNLDLYSAKYWQIPVQLSVQRYISKGFQVCEDTESSTSKGFQSVFVLDTLHLKGPWRISSLVLVRPFSWLWDLSCMGLLSPGRAAWAKEFLWSEAFMISQIKNETGMMGSRDQNRVVSRAKRTGKSGCQAKPGAPGGMGCPWAAAQELGLGWWGRFALRRRSVWNTPQRSEGVTAIN